MRCTRCHQPALPQAVGLTPEGLVVFGWCLPCLVATDCRQIVVARRSRRPKTRLTLERSNPRPSSYYRPSPPAAVPGPLDSRKAAVSAFALVLALWGLCLFSVGLTLWALGLPRATGPYGNGTPSLLIGGGGVTAALGLIFWALNSGSRWLRSPKALKAVQGVAFLTAVIALLLGVVFHSPRRDPLVVGVVSAALVVSAGARWIEVRRSGVLRFWGQEAG